MPETTIPEMVTLSGEVILDAVAELSSLSDFLTRVNGGQDTPFATSISEAGSHLFVAAFGLWDFGDTMPPSPRGATAAVETPTQAKLTERLVALSA